MEIQKNLTRNHYIFFSLLMMLWHVGTSTGSNILTIPISLFGIFYLFYACFRAVNKFGFSILVMISLMDIPSESEDYISFATEVPFLNVNILPFVFFFLFLILSLKGEKFKRAHILVILFIITFYSLATLNGLSIGKIFNGRVAIAELYTLVSYFLFLIVFYWRQEALPSLNSIVNISSIKILASLGSVLIFEGVEIGNTVLFRNPAIPFIWLIGVIILSRGVLSASERMFALIMVLPFLILNFQKGYFLYTLLFLAIIPIVWLIDPVRVKTKSLLVLLIIFLSVPLLIELVRESPKVKYEINSLSSVVSGVSPRAVEFLNITSNYREHPLSILIGTGAGSYFEEKVAKFRPWQLNTTAFTEEELEIGRYHKPHDFINWSLLKVGVGGLGLILGFLGYYFLINVAYHSYLLPAFVFFLVGLMQGISMAITSALLLVCTANQIRTDRIRRAKVIG